MTTKGELCAAVARLGAEVARLTQERDEMQRASQLLYDQDQPEAGSSLDIAVGCLVASRKRDAEMLERWAGDLTVLRTQLVAVTQERDDAVRARNSATLALGDTANRLVAEAEDLHLDAYERIVPALAAYREVMHMNDVLRECDALRTLAVQLVGALRAHGAHEESCNLYRGIGIYVPPVAAKCNCALGAALAAAEKLP